MPEMTQTVRTPAPRRRATSDSPEETMVTPTRRKKPGNDTGVGRKATSKEIVESSKEALATEDSETTRRIDLTATSQATKKLIAGRSILNRSLAGLKAKEEARLLDLRLMVRQFL